MHQPKNRDIIVTYRGGDKVSVGRYDTLNNRVTWFGDHRHDQFMFFCDLDLLVQDCSLQDLPNNPCNASANQTDWIGWLTRTRVEASGAGLLALFQVLDHENNVSRLDVKLHELYEYELLELFVRVREAELNRDDEAQAQWLKDCFGKLPAAVKVSAWKTLTSQGLDNLEFIKFVNTHLAEQVLRVFGIPFGEMGVRFAKHPPMKEEGSK